MPEVDQVEGQVEGVTTRASALSGENRLLNLDLLRFVAAAFVLLYHFTFAAHALGLVDASFPYWVHAWTRYGYMGVDLFFIISGYVVFMSSWGRTLRQFFASRVSRLYPAYWFGVTLTVLVIVLLGYERVPTTATEASSHSWDQWAVNMTMLQSMVGVPHIDGAYWSLAYELCFYGLLAILILMGITRRRALVFMGLWLVISAVFRAGLLPSAILGIADKALAPQYSHYFIAGMAMYLWRRSGLSWPIAAVIGAAWIAAVTAAWERAEYVTTITHATVNPWVAIVLVTLFFVAMICVTLGVAEGHGIQGFSTLGTLTYPLYLTHGVIGFALFDTLRNVAPVGVLFFIITAGMLILAWTITRFVERPVQPRLRRLITGALQRRAHADAS